MDDSYYIKKKIELAQNLQMKGEVLQYAGLAAGPFVPLAEVVAQGLTIVGSALEAYAINGADAAGQEVAKQYIHGSAG